MTPIAIPDDVLAVVYAHAIAAFPDECCGYLVGKTPGAVDGAVPCRNAQADGEHPIAPGRGADAGFVIAGAELFRFARSFDTDRPARVVYHSHTNGSAYFSTVDRRMAAGPAYPVQHVVVGVARVGTRHRLPPPGLPPELPPAQELPTGFPRAMEAQGPKDALDRLPSIASGAAVAPGPCPAIGHLPSVIEVAQFAWSQAARDYVEVARWSAEGAPR